MGVSQGVIALNHGTPLQPARTLAVAAEHRGHVGTRVLDGGRRMTRGEGKVLVDKREACAREAPALERRVRGESTS